jgi:hypothetical protein
VSTDRKRSWPGLPIVLGIVLAFAMTWPLALYLGRDVPGEYGDPFFDAWQVSWFGHALIHQPLDLFQSNRFWPDPDSLAYNDVMLGYAPAGLFGMGSPGAAMLVHNVLLLFTYALAFVGAYLLARELGARWPGAIVAGAAFAYAPWRLSHVRHLGVLSSGGIPLALFLLIRGYRRNNPRWVIAGWLVATWQMTLGFSLGIQFGYLLLVLAVIAGVYWLRGARRDVSRAVVGATVGGIALLTLVVALQAQPYFRVRDAHPEAARTPDKVAFLSPRPKSFLVAPPENIVWGDRTAVRRDTLLWPIEQALFPGITITLLAILGLWSKVYPASLRIGLGVGVVVAGVLSLGLPHYPDADRGFTPYRLLYKYGPGWDSIRTPGRLNTLTSLGLALLAAAGLCLIVRWVRGLSVLRDDRRRAVASLAVTGMLAGAVLLEGFGSIPHWRTPSLPAGVADAPAPQFHLPSDYPHDLIYSWWSVEGFPKMVNGAGSFEPSTLVLARSVATGFPDAASVAYLRGLGVRSVILHPSLAFGTPWQDAARRPIDGLPLTREDRGDVVIYRLAAG